MHTNEATGRTKAELRLEALAQIASQHLAHARPGSGMSTLVHCPAGLDGLTSGPMFIGDVDLGQFSDRHLSLLPRTEVGVVLPKARPATNRATDSSSRWALMPAFLPHATAGPRTR
jgi:hypothetical protein